MICEQCGTDCGFSYAIRTLENEKKSSHICYKCCTEHDKKILIEQGCSKNVPLYYFSDIQLLKDEPRFEEYIYVTNFVSDLSFKCFRFKMGKHNCFGLEIERLDVWFVGPDDYIWHGVHYGFNNTVVHCRRTKKKQS